MPSNSYSCSRVSPMWCATWEISHPSFASGNPFLIWSRSNNCWISSSSSRRIRDLSKRFSYSLPKFTERRRLIPNSFLRRSVSNAELLPWKELNSDRTTLNFKDEDLHRKRFFQGMGCLVQWTDDETADSSSSCVGQQLNILYFSFFNFELTLTTLQKQLIQSLHVLCP